MRIVGFTGRAGAGKDTAAQFLLKAAEKDGLLAKRDAFADRLKVSAAACFGVEPELALDFCNWLKQPGRYVIAAQLEGHQNTRSDDVQRRVSGREFLQFFGTEAHRDVFGDNFWVAQLFQNYEDAWLLGDRPVDLLAITDVRFENEARAVKSKGGHIVEIVRDNAPGAGDHSSEAGLKTSLVDYLIVNNGDLIDLENSVASYYESLPA